MKQSFNENWICYKTGDKENAFAVTLPHDAMQLDERSETSAGGVNTGWYEAQDYKIGRASCRERVCLYV